MKNIFLRKIPVSLRYLFLPVLQLVALDSQCQYYEEKPEPEISVGIKVMKAEIIYGPKPFYTTDPKGISLQAMIRYDAPLKIATYSPYQKRYIDLVVEGGFLFCKAKLFDSVLIDPNTNIITRDHSKNPTYFPVYIGLCNRSAFSIGASVFYWKGLGAKDICGAKFLSLGYNGKRFRLNTSGEWYTQARNTRHSGTLFSVEFLWKLVLDE